MLVLSRGTQRYLPLHHHDIITKALRHDDVMFISGGRLKSKAMTWDTYKDILFKFHIN